MSDHKFRYLLPPGNNFAFVAKFKGWLVVSILLMGASVGALFVNKAARGDYMNWTIDFKGGTEMVFAFKDKAGNYKKADPGVLRGSLEKAGEDGIDVSEIEWTDEKGTSISGVVVKTPRFSALPDDLKDRALKGFLEKFKDRKISRATWSGDRLNVKSGDTITNREAAEFLATFETSAPATGTGTSTGTGGQKLEVKPWSSEELQQYTTRDEGTREINQWYGIWGIDRQYQQLFEGALGKGTTDVIVVQSYGVGAKAGSKLRDDAAKAILFAIALIMLYLAFRFDIRYAPGAAFATIHDAVMVIGVFAVTWAEVSLVSVAGLLTVVGFSVNDTVVVFDRIRENQAKLKDKSLDRIVDISLNEVLVRSILTSATVFATTLVMNIFGTGLVQNFAFAMNVGVIVGAYSSLFLAPPFFLMISKKWYSGPLPARRRGLPDPTMTPTAKAAPAEPDEE
jgi:preprotein translocase subunit SecF